MIEIVPMNESKVQHVWSKLGRDVTNMKRKGIPLRERDEYVFEFLQSMEAKVLKESKILSEEDAAGGFDLFRGIKKMVADKISDAMGIQQGFMRDVITNFIAGLTIADVKAMFTAGSCKKVVTKLGGAIQAAIVDMILKSIGLAPTHFLSIAVTEAIKSGFVESGPFVTQASKTICSLNISELLPTSVAGAAASAKNAISSLFGSSTPADTTTSLPTVAK
jgi:hypothetical protein